MKILVVEDDVELASQLESMLTASGHEVSIASDGDEGFQRAQSQSHDVMVVDRMLPNRDGLTMLSDLREANVQTPALILSALGQVEDRVKGLRAGGDDYLAKPYAFSELLARLEILGRRSSQSSETKIEIGGVVLDRLAHTAFRDGEAVPLQPREYRLLEYLMMSEGKLVTRSMLLQQVWDLNFDPQTNVIDVHMSRLRAKIDKGHDKPLIHTVRGKGYRFGPLSY